MYSCIARVTPQGGQLGNVTTKVTTTATTATAAAAAAATTTIVTTTTTATTAATTTTLNRGPVESKARPARLARQGHVWDCHSLSWLW